VPATFWNCNYKCSCTTTFPPLTINDNSNTAKLTNKKRQVGQPMKTKQPVLLTTIKGETTTKERIKATKRQHKERLERLESHKQTFVTCSCDNKV